MNLVVDINPFVTKYLDQHADFCPYMLIAIHIYWCKDSNYTKEENWWAGLDVYTIPPTEYLKKLS